MGEAVDGLQHQQTGAEEQPAGGAGRAQVVRRVRHAAPRVQVHDLRTDAHNAFWLV